MKLLGKVWAVWAALMLFAVSPALADTVATGTDVACEHMVICTEQTTCQYCGKTMAPGDQFEINHIMVDRLHNEKYHWLECGYCDTFFEDSLEEHYRWCDDEFPDICTVCSAPYNGNDVWHTVWEWTSYDDNTHVWLCVVCDTILYGPKPHYRSCDRIHCDVCHTPYTGSNIWHYWDEVDGHNDTTHWYTCRECGKSVIEKHYSYQVPDDGICDVCDTAFTEVSDTDSSQGTSSSSGASSDAWDSWDPWSGSALWNGPRLQWYEDGMPRALVSAPKTGKATLRATPSTSGKALKQLVDGTVLVVLGESGKFTEVSFDGMTGYVLTSALEMVDMAQLPMGEGMLIYPTTGGRGTIRINVRSGASARTHKIAEWVTGTTVLVWSVSEDGKWYEIEYEDVRGYVSADFLTVTQIYDFTVEQTDEETVYAAEA